MRGKSFIVTAGMLTVLLTGCERNTASSEAVQPVSVTVQTLHGSPVTLHSELTGRVTAAMVSDVRPQVDGIIQQRLFTEGSEVKAGQVLYQIDPASYQAAVDQAAAALKKRSVHGALGQTESRTLCPLVERRGGSAAGRG
ncbi:hypothetical protein OS21_34880 [Dickeya oryzae]